MTAALDWWAMHLQHRHPCCWIHDGGTPCELWCGHAGEHLPFVPGWYLPEQILHPLDRWLMSYRLQQRLTLTCPGCGQKAREICRDMAGLVHRVDGQHLPEWEIPWRFGPCGCELRELVTDPHLVWLLEHGDRGAA